VGGPGRPRALVAVSRVPPDIVTVRLARQTDDVPPIEDQCRASVTYARTSAFSELDHQLIGHPKSQPGAAAHKPTLLWTDLTGEAAEVG